MICDRGMIRSFPGFFFKSKNNHTCATNKTYVRGIYQKAGGIPVRNKENGAIVPEHIKMKKEIIEKPYTGSPCD